MCIKNLGTSCQGYSIFWKELDEAVVGMGFDSLYSHMPWKGRDDWKGCIFFLEVALFSEILGIFFFSGFLCWFHPFFLTNFSSIADGKNWGPA